MADSAAATGIKRKRNVRQRKKSSSSEGSNSDENDDTRDKMEAMRALQKMRARQKGVSAASLALGKKIAKTDEISDADPFKLNTTGGLVDLKALKKKPLTGEAAEAIGTAFAAETNRRDEDAEMLKYVEEELARRKGHHKEEEMVKDSQKAQADSLYDMPEHLKHFQSEASQRSEDMLSNQMLSGIPEIDLGIEAKIKNIEATEDAKQKLLDERKRQRDNMPSAFVPTNVAVNFAQHKRFNIDTDNKPKFVKKVEEAKPEPVRVGDVDRAVTPADPAGEPKKSTGEKATDDYHFDKFKKQMRRF